MTTETRIEKLVCGCEWQVDYHDLVTRCLAVCAGHPKDRGRPGLLPKPLPADFTFVGWIDANVRR